MTYLVLPFVTARLGPWLHATPTAGDVQP
jgi:antibiotic biosynthesis monooxygenase (ABM) superfamily enzyme